ncbi:MAG: fluoride efflux transporter CrcB [Bacteriovoracia bacterium]
MDFLIVGLGGFIGAIMRYTLYLVERALGVTAFPWGTLAINLIGCFGAGMLFALAERMVPVQRPWLLFGAMGIIGSFTTFSAFSVESLQLFRSGHAGMALANISANVVLGLALVWGGHWVIQA